MRIACIMKRRTKEVDGPLLVFLSIFRNNAKERRLGIVCLPTMKTFLYHLFVDFKCSLSFDLNVELFWENSKIYLALSSNGVSDEIFSISIDQSSRILTIVLGHEWFTLTFGELFLPFVRFIGSRTGINFIYNVAPTTSINNKFNTTNYISLRN